MTFRSSGLFYSDAFHCWRVSFLDREPGQTFQEERSVSIFIERKQDVDDIAVLLPAVKSFDDVDGLLAAIKQRIMRDSATGGYCYAFKGSRRYTLDKSGEVSV